MNDEASHVDNEQPKVGVDRRLPWTTVRFLVPLGYTGGLFALSSIQGTPLPEDTGAQALFLWMPPSIQNLLHVPVFAGLASLWHWALRSWVKELWLLGLLAFLLTAGYGGLDEWYQSHVPGRYGSFTDLALNIAGALLAIGFLTRRAAKASPS